MSEHHAQSSPASRTRHSHIRPSDPSLHCPSSLSQLPHHSPEDESQSGMSTSFSSPSTDTSALSMSPYNQVYSASSSMLQTPEEDDTPWNLIPYDVPWGTDYFDYTTGRLPGPEGDCLFLRSPTPIEKRRTARACEKCRERKAKCSGDKPACSRCIEKGRLCEYTSDYRRTRRVKAPSQPYFFPSRIPPSISRRRHNDTQRSTPSSTASSHDSDSHSYLLLTPKQEDDELSSSALLGSPEQSRKMSLRGFQASLNSHTGHPGHSQADSQRLRFSPCPPCADAWIPPPYAMPELEPFCDKFITGHGELVSLPPNHTSSLAPQIFAPKPVRSGPFESILATSLYDGQHPHSTSCGNTLSRTQPASAAYDPLACVDPSVLVADHDSSSDAAVATAASSAPQIVSYSEDAVDESYSPDLAFAEPGVAFDSGPSYHRYLYPYLHQQPHHSIPSPNPVAQITTNRSTSQRGADSSDPHDVSVYSNEKEVYENPAASQLEPPRPFISYTLHYRYAIDTALAGSDPTSSSGASSSSLYLH